MRMLHYTQSRRKYESRDMVGETASRMSILLKVLRVYQPGGLSERSSVLWALTNTKEAATAHDVVEELRL